MSAFLRSFFKKEKPDIMENLAPLRDVGDVTDYCLYDSGGNILGMCSKYGNDAGTFTNIGMDIVRPAVLVEIFEESRKGRSRFLQVNSSRGNILIWNFGSSYLLVSMNGTKDLPVVRMIVNIFRENASKNRFFEQYFKEPSGAKKKERREDPEIASWLVSVFGTKGV